MGRLLKQGLDFHIDMCDTDDNWRLMSAEYGLVSYGVLIILLRKIYGQKGYYMEWNDRINILLASEFNTDREILKEIVNKAVEYGIFDKRLFEKYNILTSAEIQDRYLNATTRRKKVTILPEYDISTVDLCQHNDDKSTQSRVEESIAEQIIGEERKENKKASPSPTPKKKYGKYLNVELTDEEYNTLMSEYFDYTAKIDNLSQYIAISGKKYASHYAVIKSWAEDDKPKNSSFDADTFFALAANRDIRDCLT